MKTNQKFNSFLSIRSIKVKALRASALAATRTEAQPQANRAKISRKKSGSNLDREINSIFQIMKSVAADNEKIGGKDCCFKAKISIFNASDLLSQNQEEEDYRKALAAGAERSKLKKPFKATPKMMYTFYASTYTPDKLGSVAIYGDSARATESKILLSGRLFGHTVSRVSVEMERHVVLAA